MKDRQTIQRPNEGQTIQRPNEGQTDNTTTK